MIIGVDSELAASSQGVWWNKGWFYVIEGSGSSDLLDLNLGDVTLTKPCLVQISISTCKRQVQSYFRGKYGNRYLIEAKLLMW